jgi:hypothetical protein
MVLLCAKKVNLRGNDGVSGDILNALKATRL